MLPVGVAIMAIPALYVWETIYSKETLGIMEAINAFVQAEPAKIDPMIVLPMLK